MAASQKNIVGEEDIVLSGEDIKEMTENTRSFSLALRALYTHKVLDDKSDAAIKFKDVRDETAQHANVYAKHVIPETTNFIRSLKDYFVNYTVPFDDWSKMLPSILIETEALITDVEKLLDLYHNIMVPLKKCEDKARVISAEFHILQTKYEEECKKYEREADKIKNKYSFQILNRITYPFRTQSVEAKMDLAQKAKARSKPHKNAAEIVDKTFISKLQKFIASLENISGFFTVTKQDLISFKDTQKPENRKKMKQHYDNMNHGASGIKAACNIFFSSLPAVTTNFDALPIQGSAQRQSQYVTLEMQPSEIPPQPKYVLLKLSLPENP
ncbi:uncharacterized protein LOC114523010 isoform X2 [Dendronephthya gigantea]|uniref:uncharacterized protein LOC114523010 isoform X2 n=1 Tax=Dendronephthya gigantea TaxID=151771 RepID=UPI00106A48E5|nr:uncharacterized protein LOC114523010 isoform X2 [Dendronephthya gigantea]XP_028399617.1 uncharacterized protein LOC114523010 isoform X2 [Dendronephthya gigantea]